jgi:uncharacterized protein YoxC
MAGNVINTETILILCGPVILNLGILGYVAKTSLTTLAKHKETIPALMKVVEGMQDTADRLMGHVEEITKEKERLNKRVERIETVHDLRGCNLPIDPLWLKSSLFRDKED